MQASYYGSFFVFGHDNEHLKMCCAFFSQFCDSRPLDLACAPCLLAGQILRA